MVEPYLEQLPERTQADIMNLFTFAPSELQQTPKRKMCHSIQHCENTLKPQYSTINLDQRPNGNDKRTKKMPIILLWIRSWK